MVIEKKPVRDNVLGIPDRAALALLWLTDLMYHGYHSKYYTKSRNHKDWGVFGYEPGFLPD